MKTLATSFALILGSVVAAKNVGLRLRLPQEPAGIRIEWDGTTLTIPQHTDRLNTVIAAVASLSTSQNTLGGRFDQLSSSHNTLVGRVDQLREELDDYKKTQAQESTINIEALQKQVDELNLDVTKTPLNHHAFTCADGNVHPDSRRCYCKALMYGGGTYVSGTAYPACHTCSNINCAPNNYQTGKCSTDEGDNFKCNVCDNISCGAGKYQQGKCEGRVNSFTCHDCDNQTCGAGQYQKGTCENRENGFWCQQCDNQTCGQDEYQTGSCSGRNNGLQCHACKNTECAPGYKRTGTCNASTGGYTCVDVDECATGMHNCHAQATCANTQGDFTCVCKSGYTGDGTDCANVDDCASNPCQNGGTCQDGVNSFTCTCAAGYTGDRCQISQQVTLTRPQYQGYYFHSTTSGTHACQRLGHSTGTVVEYGRTEVCRIWYTNDLRNMGCGNSEPLIQRLQCQ